MHRSNANARVQVSGWAGASSLHAGEGGTSVRYKGMVDCFVRTWQEEGYRAFFKVPPARPAVSAFPSHSAMSRGTGVCQQHGQPRRWWPRGGCHCCAAEKASQSDSFLWMLVLSWADCQASKCLQTVAAAVHTDPAGPVPSSFVISIHGGDISTCRRRTVCGLVTKTMAQYPT